MAEGDRGVAAPREDEPGQAAVAHIEEAAVPDTGQGEGEQAYEVADRIRVMRDEPRQALSGRFR
jgi:hypothetical protein